ncbi:Parallel_beta-helix repeat [Hexamita inflata]|uniref:Parallel beta-helix repeat n=1 Tax=Hexamita inflata TaxID=28002 RepID=A0AA86Q6K3_9EUKA|nr:Parallel beta-helix repeat [Hexamita inflata]
MILNSNIFTSSQTTHIFIYTEISKKQQIYVNLKNSDIYALFGFNSKNLSISDSIINVSTEVPIITAALICILCDTIIQRSILVFQASGRQISGVMIQSISNIQLVSTSLQFRFNSSQTSGIVNMVNSSLDKFELSACKLIGTNLQSSENNGYISSSVFQSFTLTLNSVQVCVNGTNRTGTNSSSFVQIGTTDPRCDICQTGSVVYGLCLQELHFGTLHDGMLQCIFPFEFVNEECRCAQGFLLNVSACINIMDKLLSNFDSNNNSYVSLLQQLENNITQQIDQQDRQYEILDQNIYKNSSLIYNQIINNSKTFDQQLLNNISQIYNEILLQNKYIQDNSTGFNNIIQQLNIQINSINQSSLQCNSNNSSIIINNSTNNYTLNTQNNISNNIYTNITINDTYIHEYMIPCDQSAYATTFDIASATHPVGPASFAGGYAIASSSNISNAFIDVQDNTYATVVYPLFQNQSSFTNIKIQIGTQVAGAGSLLSTSPTLAINQVNIVSKDGSQITVNATFKLSILAQSTTSVIASDLLLNLSFSTATQGNISLIESATGVFNVTGFQVLGTYQSQGCVALGANTANTSAVIMNNVSFAPSAFNVGNQSSYLFTKVNSSQIKLTNVTVKLGNSSHPAMSNFVFVTAVYYYQFGGLVSQMNSTNLQVSDISYDCKQIYKIYYIQYSGLLVGIANSSTSNITMQQICLAHVIKSYSSFSCFGVVGQLEGPIQMKQSNIFMNITSSDAVSYFGTVGYALAISPYTNLQNTHISVAINQNKGSYVAAWVGCHLSPNGTIFNSTIRDTNVTSSQFAGGFYAQSVAAVISYSSVANCNISSLTHVAGFIGFLSINVSLQNSTVKNNIINCSTTGAGGFVGSLQSSTTLNLVNDNTTNCSIRGKQQSGGLIGLIDAGDYVQISDCLVQNTTVISTTSMAGGLVGAIYTYYVKIVTSRIQSINISSADYVGLAVGYNQFQYIVLQSMPYGDNYINSILKQNCLNFAVTCSDNSTINDIYIDITINDTYIHEYMIPCDQSAYATTFDIASATYPVGPASFAGGYAIASSSNISNAFIDVQDNTYATVVYPLFQNQSSFTNIKIQIGTQVAGAGSLLSTSPTLAINQVNIVSKDGSQITVNATFKLSILAQSTTSVIASDLLLNLSFSTATQGNISLIESATGVFNVTGFQVLGTYQSQGCFALGANTANTSAVIMNNVSFAPSAFNVGNQSSYLFTKVNSSQIKLTNVTVKLGNSSHPAMSNFVFVTAVYYYQFGGLVSQMNSTNLQVSDISYDCKQIYKIYYIQYSGLLVGIANSSTSNITMQQICLAHVIKSYSSFSCFGVVGQLEGPIQMKQSNIFMNITSSDAVSYFGTVGYALAISPYTNLQNTHISVAINQNKGSYVAAWVGCHLSPNGTIFNSTIRDTNVTSSQFAGGFYAQSVAAVISYSSVANCNISSLTHVAGFIGFLSINVSLQNSTVKNNIINCSTTGAGGFVGSLQSSTTLNLVNDNTTNCSIRGKQQSGGLIGLIDAGDYVQISDCLVQNTTVISTTSMAGGLVGAIYTYYVKIVTSRIQSINISSADYVGLAVGYNQFQYIVLQSMPYGDNYINSILKQNCLNFAVTCSDNSTINDIYIDITINDTYIHEYMIPCDQSAYATTFDIASATHPVGPASFAGGYAIASSSNISNAFIDVQDNTYATVVYPLFQNQSSFTNIKIQIGTQVAGAGSLLSTSPTLAINQVNIVSKDGSQITVNATFKLSILAQSTTSVIASDLLLNLSFSTATQGNISLIDSATGVFNVTGFQVLGTYQSQGCVALGANTANTSAVIMNNVSFAPSAFNVGNQSSYLFTKVNSSQIKLTNVTVKLGNSSHPAMSNFVFVTAVYYYQFGGLVSQMNSTNLQVSDISYDCKQIYKIYYIQYSGLLVGIANSSTSNITMQQICLAHVIKSYSSFSCFGVVGQLEGPIQMKQSNIFMNITSSDSVSYFGTVGYALAISPYTNLQNTHISVAVNQNKGSYVAAWVGYHLSPNGTIFNSSVRDTNVSSSQFAGGFYAQSVAAVISYSSVANCNISSLTHAAGFIGYLSINVSLQNSTVKNNIINCSTTGAGGFVGSLQTSTTLNLVNDNTTNCSLRGKQFTGGLIGLIESGDYVQISDCLVQNTTVISTTSMAGGLVGAMYTYYVKIVTSRIQSINISSADYVGLAVGYNQFQYIVLQSMPYGDNYINSILKQNCLNFAATCSDNSTINDIYIDITINDTYINETMILRSICVRNHFRHRFCHTSSGTQALRSEATRSRPARTFRTHSSTGRTTRTPTSCVPALPEPEFLFTNIKIQIGTQVAGAGSLFPLVPRWRSTRSTSSPRRKPDHGQRHLQAQHSGSKHHQRHRVRPAVEPEFQHGHPGQHLFDRERDGRLQRHRLPGPRHLSKPGLRRTRSQHRQHKRGHHEQRQLRPVCLQRRKPVIILVYQSELEPNKSDQRHGQARKQLTPGVVQLRLRNINLLLSVRRLGITDEQHQSPGKRHLVRLQADIQDLLHPILWAISWHSQFVNQQHYYAINMFSACDQKLQQLQQFRSRRIARGPHLNEAIQYIYEHYQF